MRTRSFMWFLLLAFSINLVAVYSVFAIQKKRIRGNKQYLSKEIINAIDSTTQTPQEMNRILSGGNSNLSCNDGFPSHVDYQAYKNPRYQNIKVQGEASIYGFDCNRSNWPNAWKKLIAGKGDCFFNGNPVYASGKVTNKFGKIIPIIRLNPNIPLVAYNKLPPGHCVKVTTKEGNSGVFQVLDTGAFDKFGRVIDLSFAAAKQLKLKGTTEKGITVQSSPCPLGTPYYPIKR